MFAGLRGALKQFTYGNGIARTLTRNARGLPEESRYDYGSIKFLDDVYDFDEVGNVVAITDGATNRDQRGNRTMTYDGLDRLTGVVSPMYGTAGAHYTYDVLDNLVHTIAPGRDQWLCYDQTNRLSNVMVNGDCSTGSTILGLGYDAQGNLANWNGKVHNFDYGNRLRSVTDVESYRYDAHGRRIRAWTPSAGLLYSLYSQAGQLLWQRDSRAGKRREYVHLNGSLVAERTRPLSGSTETITYQHTDALGTPVLKTSASRVILERREYEPYGKLLNQPMASGPGFTGHDTDPATQYTYMQQRYYDPRVGRFWSVDPVTVDSAGGNFNRYWYGNNNPYRFTDPDGRQVAVPWGQIGEVAAKRGSQAAIASQLDSPVPGPGDVVGAIILVSAIVEIGHTVWQANQEGDAPALPDGLVGNDQTPRGSGNSVTSGTLSSDFGGTGDYDADLETLAGETRPAGPGDNAPSGAQIGTNGVFGRENSSGGRSIDIPANGDKPHETLHYPREEK